LAIIVDMLASAILLLLLMLADWAGMAGAPLLIAIATMYSLTSPLSGSGVRVLIPRLVPNEALERANALDTGSYALIEIIGPALAGGLSGYAGAQATMLVIASLYTMAAVSLIPLRRGSEGSGGLPSIGLIAQAGAGLVYVARHRSLRGLAVSYCLYQMSWGVLLVVVPVAISRGLSSAAHADLAVGLLWAVAGLTGGLGALLAGRVRTIGRERQMIGFGIAATALAIYPLSASLGLCGLAAGTAIVGFLEGSTNVGVLTLRQRRTEPQWLGRVLTISMGLNMSGLPIGSAISGWLVTRSISAALMFAALVSIVSAVAAFRLIPSAAAIASECSV
jgi:hypothetical protein